MVRLNQVIIALADEYCGIGMHQTQTFGSMRQEDSQYYLYSFLGKRHLSMDYLNDYCTLRNYDADVMVMVSVSITWEKV